MGCRRMAKEQGSECPVSLGVWATWGPELLKDGALAVCVIGAGGGLVDCRLRCEGLYQAEGILSASMSLAGWPRGGARCGTAIEPAVHKDDAA